MNPHAKIVMNPHKVFLRVVSDDTGRKTGVCDPSAVEDNQVQVGQIVRFEAADSSHSLHIDLTGEARFTPGVHGTFFQEHTALTPGRFKFVAKLTLPGDTPVWWASGEGGEGIVR
jgi:hypothetical protein